MHVFLVRHGETALNAAGVLRGQLDIPLNATGEAEAAALGEVFRGVPLSAVVSSPLKRAFDTARPVAAASRAILTIDDRLSDRFYGEWAGHSLEQVEERFGSIDSAPLVEAWQLLEARTEEAFLNAVATGEASGAAVGDVKAGVALGHPRRRAADASRATAPGSQLGEARPPDRIVVRARARGHRQAMESGAPRRASGEWAPARSLRFWRVERTVTA